MTTEKALHPKAREGDPNGKKQQLGKRILMSALGIAICGVSVGMFKHAALGVDPF